MRCLRSDMDEVGSMWMEMVVFRIDLMNSWIGWHGCNRCDVDGIELPAYDETVDGCLRCGGPDTCNRRGRWVWTNGNEMRQKGGINNRSQPHTIVRVQHGWWDDGELDRIDDWTRTTEFDEENAIARLSVPCRIISLPTTGIHDNTTHWWSWRGMDIMETSVYGEIWLTKKKSLNWQIQRQFKTIQVKQFNNTLHGNIILIGDSNNQWMKDWERIEHFYNFARVFIANLVISTHK